MTTLRERAKTPREIAKLIERRYEEDEMGNDYLDYINFHDELEFVEISEIKSWLQERLIPKPSLNHIARMQDIYEKMAIRKLIEELK